MPSVKPRFNKKLPAKWKGYFRFDLDKKFIKEHPKAYYFFVFLGICAIIGPIILWVYLTTLIGIKLSSTDTREILLCSVGLIGSFSIATGLFNIIAAFLHQYLGHKVTIISIAGGLFIWLIIFVILRGGL
jgi:hypothetical protein